LVTIWTPEPGDLIWVDFSPTAGTEQSGRRPALVISGKTYNALSGRIVVVPITKRIRGWLLETPLPPDSTMTGAVMVDHIRNIDWRARFAQPAGKVSDDIMQDVRAKIAALLELD
jgi:mRNA interferase MazF